MATTAVSILPRLLDPVRASSNARANDAASSQRSPGYSARARSIGGLNRAGIPDHVRRPEAPGPGHTRPVSA